jgi:hypothetical protein
VQRPQKQRAQVKEGTGAKRGRKMNRGWKKVTKRLRCPP